MSDKPTSGVDWSSTGTRTAPSTPAKAAGFIKGAKWAAQHANWLLGTISDWIDWINAGYLTRASLVDDSPVQAQTDQDANVKTFIDANGYNFGQVIRESYWYKPGMSGISAPIDVSMGSPFYLSVEEAGFVATVEQPPNNEIGAHMVKIVCAASPTFGNGALVSCDDRALLGDNEVFGNLADAIAVFETTFITSNVTTSASSFYAGFHEVNGNPSDFEGAAFPCCCIVLDYGEAVFEGMTCDGTTNTKNTTSTTCVINTLYHLRVEMHGANTPQGVDAGGAVARFFIDGALVLEKTTNMPLDAAWLGPCFGVQGISTNAASDIHVGPVHFAVNYMPSSQVPA